MYALSLKNPLLLDATINIEIEDDAENDTVEKEYGSNFEFCSASLLNDDLLLAVASNANTSLYWWDMGTKKIVRKVETEQQLGNLFAIDENWAWNLFQHPKLIDLKMGKIKWQEESINSGKQNSSIIGNLELPSIAWNRKTDKLAIGGENKVEILSLLTS